MKVLVIPDVHLKPWMFDQATELMNTGIAEKAVCLMDIPDDWGKQMHLNLYSDTFDRAIRFQNDFPSTLWCYGNHDLSYLWDAFESGFSRAASSIVVSKIRELQAALPSPWSMQMAYVQKIDNVLFLHGGLTDNFVKRYVQGVHYTDVDAVVREINETLGFESIWRNDSPVWHRPQYELDRLYMANDILQVVGHTPVSAISRGTQVNPSANLISCDVFSTMPDGSPIGTKEFLLIDTETWDAKGVKPKK